MTQLKFDDQFETIIEDIPTHHFWKSKDDIPPQVGEFIRQTSDNRVLMTVNGEYFCPFCFHALDDHGTCIQCKRTYHDYLGRTDSRNRILIHSLSEIPSRVSTTHYYVFDIHGKEVILYVIKEELYYYSPVPLPPENLDILDVYRSTSLSIQKAYYVEKEDAWELITKRKIHYAQIDMEEDVDLLEDYAEACYLYSENMDLLRHTVYRYSHLFDAKPYGMMISPNFGNLVYGPIYYPAFEYMMKKGFYHLAFDGGYRISYDKTMKKWLQEQTDFIQEYQLGYEEFLAFQLCRKRDFSLISFVKGYTELLEEIVKLTHLSLSRLQQYFEEQHLEQEMLIDYYDYLQFAKQLGYNLKDKKVQFPPNFQEAHDTLWLEQEMIQNPTLEKHIQELSNVLELNRYEDEQYIIFPAPSLSSLVEESEQQQNCVRHYGNRYGENDSQIYFMREKKNPHQSLITIEVRNGKIVQARTKYNDIPSDYLQQVLKRWEQTLIDVRKE